MFRLVALAATAIFVILFVVLAFAPATYVATYGVAGDAGAAFMARRASPMFLGLALLCWQMRDAPLSPLRRAICWSIAAVFAGIAISGVIAYLSGAASATILIAAMGEVFVAAMFVAVRDR